MFVKPTGVNAYETIQARLDVLSYDFGIDAIAEDSSIMSTPKSGA